MKPIKTNFPVKTDGGKVYTAWIEPSTSMVGVFKPFERRNAHVDSSRSFQLLMLRLVYCEKISEYKAIRKEIPRSHFM